MDQAGYHEGHTTAWRMVMASGAGRRTASSSWQQVLEAVPTGGQSPIHAQEEASTCSCRTDLRPCIPAARDTGPPVAVEGPCAQDIKGDWFLCICDIGRHKRPLYIRARHINPDIPSPHIAFCENSKKTRVASVEPLSCARILLLS